MQRSCFWAVMAVVVGSTAANAQTQPFTATGSINAYARVAIGVTLSNPTDLDFGTLLPGGTSAVVPPSYSATVPKAGSIQLDYGNGTLTINVTIDPGDELRTPPNMDPSLNTTLSCAIGASATDVATTPIPCTGQSFTITSQTGSTGFIFVGGQVSAPANAKAGLHSGVVTVRVSLASQ